MKVKTILEISNVYATGLTCLLGTLHTFIILVKAWTLSIFDNIETTYF